MQFHVSNNRLLRLAKFLRTLPPERFDYSLWVGADWNGKSLNSCDTTACALGWATMIPSLRRAGLVLKKYTFSEGGYVGLRHDTRSVSLDAAAEVFGISEEEAHQLFMAQNSNEAFYNAKDVAGKIETFVKNRKKP